MIYALALLQGLVVLAISPLMVGIVRRCKAKFQNRIGASIFLPYWTLLSACKKEMTITRHSSWVFRTVPFVVLGSALFLAFLTPTLVYGILPLTLTNVFLLSGVLAIGSLFLVFGGMDTGSTFGNMGSEREMTIASLVEPALYISLATLGFIAGSWSIDGIVMHFATSAWMAVVPVSGLVLVALFLVLLAENARYPVDNPATHLELTMVHEAMLLEYSGPYLAILEYASTVKLTVMAVLLANLIAPWGLASGATLASLPLALLMLVVKVACAGFVIAFVESTLVKMRFYRMQEYMSLAFLTAFGGLIVALVSIF